MGGCLVRQASPACLFVYFLLLSVFFSLSSSPSLLSDSHTVFPLCFLFSSRHHLEIIHRVTTLFTTFPCAQTVTLEEWLNRGIGAYCGAGLILWARRLRVHT
jgi:hypothetical protein